MSNERKFLIGIGFTTLIIVVIGLLVFARGEKQVNKGVFAPEELLAGATHTMGEATAAAVIVEFGDYQCPACGQAHPILKQFLKDHDDSVYFVFRHFPLTAVHQNANDAARSAEAAGKQGKYWEMHNILFERQKEWSSLSDARGKFEQYAKELELDMDRFKADQGQAIGVVNTDAALGTKAGVQSTPTFFVNGKMYPGVLTYDKLVELTK